MYWLEHCESVYLRAGNMLPQNEVNSKTGYRSVYGFSEEDALKIKAAQQSRGFSEYAVFSEELFFDLDTLDYEEVTKITEWFKQRDIGYSVFWTGKKGYRPIVPTTLQHSKHLPYTQRKIATSLSEAIDTSIYRHSSLIKMPGTVHEETGKVMELVDCFIGEYVFDYSIIEQPLSNFTKVTVEDNSFFMDAVTKLLAGFGSTPGCSRYQYMFFLGYNLLKSGLSKDTVSELVDKINQSWGKDAKEEKEVLRALKDANNAVISNW